jgi:protein-S-isoprenylcysteine O-methyltransferase Ste14
VRRGAAAAGSALFFLLAPGSVVVLLPWLLTRWHTDSVLPWPLRVLGVLLILAGLAVIVPAFVRFVVEGSGTPAPVAETDRLVVGGLYRYVRNPMYVAVLLAVAGQALLLGSWVLVVYWLCAAAAMVGFVKGYEEPRLARRFGPGYARYRAAVPGWIPRAHPWTPPVD